ARALRGAHAQAPDRHPLADPEDGRLAHAARPPGRRRHRDQALMTLTFFAARTLETAANRRIAASLVASVASGYQCSLPPRAPRFSPSESTICSGGEL